MDEQNTYQEFRQQYEQQHPASIPRLEQDVGIYPDWLEIVVGLMFICASLLSGVHTVPAVRQGMNTIFWPVLVINIVSLASFVAIELVFFVAAYALMRRFQWHVAITLAAAFIVAMIANLQQNIIAYQAGDVGTLIVAATLGIGAPLIAFMAGKMFVDIHRARRSVGIDARRKYDNDMIAWDKEIERAWKASNRPSKLASKYVQSSPSRPVKSMDASERVRQHLDDHPEDIEGLSSGKLASMLGVSKATANNVQRKMRMPLVASNGNGKVHRLDD